MRVRKYAMYTSLAWLVSLTIACASADPTPGGIAEEPGKVPSKGWPKVDEQGTTTYRSSVLGFAIDYPAGWKKRRPLMCGSGYIGLTPDQYERVPVDPVQFYDSNRQAHFHVTIFRHVPADLDKRLAWHRVAGGKRTRFVLGCGLAADKFVNTGLYLDEDRPEGSTRAFYRVVTHNRMIELSGVAPSDIFQAIEPAFDALSASLVLMEPAAPGTEGTFSEFRGSGFRFEYPSHWHVRLDWDDDLHVEQGIKLYLAIEAPRTRESASSPRVSISCSQHPLDPVGRSTIDDLYRQFDEPLKGMEGASSCRRFPYRSASGQEGIRIEYTFAPASINWSSRAIIFALPTADGRVQVLTCTCSPTKWTAMKTIFEHVGSTFAVER